MYKTDNCLLYSIWFAGEFNIGDRVNFPGSVRMHGYSAPSFFTPVFSFGRIGIPHLGGMAGVIKKLACYCNINLALHDVSPCGRFFVFIMQQSLADETPVFLK